MPSMAWDPQKEIDSGNYYPALNWKCEIRKGSENGQFVYGKPF